MGRCVIVFIGLNAILLILRTPQDPVASGSILSVKIFLKMKVIIFFLILSISHLIQFTSVLFYSTKSQQELPHGTLYYKGKHLTIIQRKQKKNPTII